MISTNDDEKVYAPVEISDTPFPQEQTVSTSDTQSTNNGVTTPKQIQDQPFPNKMIAHELIGPQLNTQSKKILAEFQFTPSGAIQIGEYQNGVSGDIRISPNGIVGRDSAGNTTFTLDGDTGDATFKGTIQSGSVITDSIISGNISVGGKSNGQGQIGVYDANGNLLMTLANDGIDIYNSGALNFEPGTEGAVMFYDSITSTLKIIALDHNFFMETDSGEIKFFTSGNFKVDIDGSKFQIFNNGAQIAEIQPSGAMLISGALTQNHTF